MKLRTATFRRKLMLTMLGFVTLAELVVAAAVLQASYDQTVSRAHESLRVGDRVLNRLMAQRGQQLLSTVEVLASDFGFKSAVATHDSATLRTVLANFGDRVDADVALLTDPAGRLTAAVPGYGTDTDALPLGNLLARARKAGSATGLMMARDRAYQFVLAPVRAPRLIAWAGMGFQIDHELARELASLTGLDIEFIVFQGDQELFRTGTLSAAPGKNRQQTDSGNFLTSRNTLLDAGDTRLDAVLALNRSKALSGYYRLARNLLIIFVATLLLSIAVAIWLTRKISQPIRDLSEFAGSVASGEYGQPPPRTQGIRELSMLAGTLSTMQSSVRQREDRLRHQALHDQLTGLPNRESLRESLGQYLRNGRRFAALRIAIYGFSRINGALGYQLGDQVMVQMAARLHAALPGESLLARTEGNDFIALLDYNGKDASLDAEIRQMREQVEQPIELLNTPIAIALEIGVVLVPQQADGIEAIWRRSVIARDCSRAAKGNTFFYQHGMDEAHARELAIIRDLAPALEQGELFLVYQPKMVLRSGAVHQVEVLTRWQHPALGRIGPDEFVGLAERTGQITLLTRWIVHQLIEQLQQWRAAGMHLGVAINLSADELADPGLTAMITPLLDAASSKQLITLEVTESALLRDPESALANLKQLQTLGARVAVDDFGTGYSSLAQIKQLSADELKIDKSLVLNLDTTPADQFIVRTIIDLGHKMGLDVVAEGIESVATWRHLVEADADLMQGYYLARPMLADKLAEWMHTHAREQDQWSATTILGEGGQSPWRHLNS